VIALLGSSLLNAAYFLPILHRAWFVEPVGADPGLPGRPRIGWMLVAPPLATAALARARRGPHGQRALQPARLDPVHRGDRVHEPWLLFGAGAVLDTLARVFLGFTAFLWLAAALAARHWLLTAKDAAGFTIAFLLAMAGNLGLILASDVASFYAFFAMMSFASYGLVIHFRTPEALFAGWRYIGFVLAGELALFAGLALAVDQAGSLLLADLRATALAPTTAALILTGFGVKLGIMPLHFWLPPAHGAAPAPASAVLSGAMIKAGLFGMMAALPLGIAALPEHGIVLLAAGLVTIFAAAILGAREPNPKAVLGFSSVGQMGMVALGIGAALVEPAAWAVIAPALVFLAVHHALAKAALFLGVGAFLAGGPFRRRSCLLALLALPALVLAGAPMTSGAQAKAALKAALDLGPAAWGPWLGLALSLSTVATTLLMARFAVTLWRAAPASAVPGPATALPFVALAALALALPRAWPAVAPDLAAAMPAADASGGMPMLLLGIALAAATGLVAAARAVGPARLGAHAVAPARRLAATLASRGLRLRRGARVHARRVPAALAVRAETWRLGQVATVALLVAVLAIEGAAQIARVAPE
jgi:formate hydrogenlyase subunit 3/multisubunit Na+/H+ antiporter MnhD subunit